MAGYILLQVWLYLITGIGDNSLQVWLYHITGMVTSYYRYGYIITGMVITYYRYGCILLQVNVISYYRCGQYLVTGNG